MTANNCTPPEGENGSGESSEPEVIGGHVGNLNGSPDVWVPPEVCEVIGVGIGDRVEFVVREGGVELRAGEGSIGSGVGEWSRSTQVSYGTDEPSQGDGDGA